MQLLDAVRLALAQLRVQKMFGLMPAMKAARLDPVEALRFE